MFLSDINSTNVRKFEKIQTMQKNVIRMCLINVLTFTLPSVLVRSEQACFLLLSFSHYNHNQKLCQSDDSVCHRFCVYYRFHLEIRLVSRLGVFRENNATN